MSGKYDDIIDLPHHTSATRLRMSRADRAAQFSPFAALTGYDTAIRETGRLTDAREEMSEERKAALDRAFVSLLDRLGEQPAVRIVYFVPDAVKEGGAYVTVQCRVRKVDLHHRLIICADTEPISMDDVWEMELL